MSLEHIWPQWMVSMFPQDEYTAGRRVDTPDGPIEKTWRTNSVDHKAGVVCRACNEGWMSGIESETKPILKPIIEQPRITRRLNLHQQSVLANWVALRAMIFDR